MLKIVIFSSFFGRMEDIISYFRELLTFNRVFKITPSKVLFKNKIELLKLTSIKAKFAFEIESGNSKSI